MITEFKLFESLEDVELQNNFANAIVDLYESENITAQNNFYDLIIKDEPVYTFRILEFYKNKIMMDIEYYKSEPWVSIYSTMNDDDNISKFIKYILSEYDEIISYPGGWTISAFQLKNLPEATEKLSVDNYKMWKDANKYNL